MLLEQIHSPADLKKLSLEQLPDLATEIRRKILETVTKTGGHLGSGMGVVELTIALHYVYDIGVDRLFLDTGHQCYPHKLLTGRQDRFHTLRTYGGISGFPNIDESPEYDMMTSGHAGTAASMALGACVGDALLENGRRTVAVVGDASFVSGMSFEALNAAGHLDEDLLVILNANEQSIGATTGAFARMLSRVRMSKLYLGAKEGVARFERFLSSLPVIGDKMEKVDRGAHELVDHVKNAFVPNHVFEELGFRYFGLYDGHDVVELVQTLRSIQKQPGMKLLHVQTVKGKGVDGCEEDPLALHGAKPGDSFTLSADSCVIGPEDAEGEPVPAASEGPKVKKYDFAKCLSEAVLAEAETRPELVAITAGMPDGTGLSPFQKRFPERFHNVGIAEQHAYGFASGLSKAGARPVVIIYSTFMQRGFDQIFQEIALQRAPVTMMLSHGGFAGEDGATHHGLFDIALLRAIPGVVLMAPRDGSELQEMFRVAVRHDGPVAVRYPKSTTEAPGRTVAPIEMGKAEVLREGREVALLGYGPMSDLCLKAATELEAEGLDCFVASARFARPLDTDLVQRLVQEYRVVVTVEEGTTHGGYGAAVLEYASTCPEVRARIHSMGVPDQFIEHGKRDQLLTQVGLTTEGIRSTVLRLIGEGAQLRTAP